MASQLSGRKKFPPGSVVVFSSKDDSVDPLECKGKHHRVVHGLYHSQFNEKMRITAYESEPARGEGCEPPMIEGLDGRHSCMTDCTCDVRFSDKIDRSLKSSSGQPIELLKVGNKVSLKSSGSEPTHSGPLPVYEITHADPFWRYVRVELPESQRAGPFCKGKRGPGSGGKPGDVVEEDLLYADLELID